MAVDQDLLDQIAGTVADLYREVETSLVTVIADELKRGLDAPTAEVKLDAIRRLRTAAEQVQARLAKTKSAAVREAIRTAYRSGTTSALTSIPTDILTKLKAQEAMPQVPNAAVVENLAQALHRDLGRVEGNILRAPEDAYRAVQAATAARIATGTATRRQASQAAWQRLMDKGITSFTDSRGRLWRLSSYAEMIGRTNIARAAVQGQMDRLESIGIDLVYVSDNSQECKVCRPYESKVLRRDSGPIGRIQVEHGTRDGEMVTVDVLDTVAGAQSKGFQHPNCRHSMSAYLPGVTKLKKATADPEGDKARQQQRALERKIRAAKEQELGALDEPAKKAARAKVRAAQAQLRDHLAANPKLKRLPYREAIGAGNHPGPGGPKGGPVSDLVPPGSGPAPKAKSKADPAAAAVAKAKAAKEAEEKAEAAQQAEEKAQVEKLLQEAEAAIKAAKAKKARKAAEAKAQPTKSRPSLSGLIPKTFAEAEARKGELKKTFAGAMDRQYGALNTRIEDVQLLADRVEVFGKIHDAKGAQVGEFTRIFFRDSQGRTAVEHALLELHRDVQGQGFAKKFNADMESWYRASGVDRIELHANIDVGGYAWSRSGYDFADEDSAAAILEGLEETIWYSKEALRELQAKAPRDAQTTAAITAAESEIEEAEKLLERGQTAEFGSDDFPSALEIGQVGRTPGAADWLGKRTLLGAEWSGVKWLSR